MRDRVLPLPAERVAVGRDPARLCPDGVRALGRAALLPCFDYLKCGAGTMRKQVREHILGKLRGSSAGFLYAKGSCLGNMTDALVRKCRGGQHCSTWQLALC